MLELMNDLALELNEQRRRELALESMRARLPGRERLGIVASLLPMQDERIGDALPEPDRGSSWTRECVCA